MSAAMYKALMAMSLDDDDDVPFDMPDLPEFRSCERNVISVIGRCLNPSATKMSNLILDMPRKWQIYENVRGIALSKERFQFIFRYEHDLVTTLNKGLHSFNEWSLAIERWVENPPADYLQKVLLWVQIRNIPVNYYTEAAITVLGELVGEVKMVAFDPEKPQSQEFVRVQVLFDVSKPLRKKRIINLPNGGSTEINFFYERVQKRCYKCQRMTHDQDSCPLIIKEKQELTLERKAGTPVEKKKPELVLKVNDPLYGVLDENQVGIHPVLRRPKIAEEVLEGMRQYLLVAEGEECRVREERVRRSVKEAEQDSATQKTVLRLEAPVIVTKDLNKGKGLVFGYESSDVSSVSSLPKLGEGKLLGDAIMADERSRLVCYDSSPISEFNSVFNRIEVPSYRCSSTENRVKPVLASSSGAIKKTRKPRKRPYLSERSPKSGLKKRLWSFQGKWTEDY